MRSERSQARSSAETGRLLTAMYEAMYVALGPQHWWPGETPTEVIVGAILTQNTSWANVERAIARLKEANRLTLPALHALSDDELATLIRPAGTYRVKARRLKALVDWIYGAFGGDLAKMFGADPHRLREELLGVSGIGPETADAILLYAAGAPTFVVDAYTQRILRRHFVIGPGTDYAATKAVFESHLAADAALFGEYHALFVAVGKRFCRTTARCDDCPLQSFAHDPER